MSVALGILIWSGLMAVCGFGLGACVVYSHVTSRKHIKQHMEKCQEMYKSYVIDAKKYIDESGL